MDVLLIQVHAVLTPRRIPKCRLSTVGSRIRQRCTPSTGEEYGSTQEGVSEWSLGIGLSRRKTDLRMPYAHYYAYRSPTSVIRETGLEFSIQLDQHGSDYNWIRVNGTQISRHRDMMPKQPVLYVFIILDSSMSYDIPVASSIAVSRVGLHV